MKLDKLALSVVLSLPFIGGLWKSEGFENTP